MNTDDFVGGVVVIGVIILTMFYAILAITFMQLTYGENHTLPDEHGNYTFNMTKEMIDEGRLLQFCIVDTEMEIEGIPEFCSTRYGGIDTPYGEPKK